MAWRVVGTLLGLALCAAGCTSSEERNEPTLVEAPLGEKPASEKPDTKKNKSKKGSTPSVPEPSAGCASGGGREDATGGTELGRSIEVWGEERSYDLLVPSSYDPTRSYPLVFVFHGGGGSSESARYAFDFSEVAGDDAIFVYPSGRWGHWDLESPTDENADVAFFDALIERVEGSYCVDRSRVFATGYSNGGFFSNQLGCRRGDVLRGIAPHASGGPFGRDEDYNHDGHLECAGAPVAAMIVHGEWDDTVSIDDGRRTVSHWRWANGCSGKATDVEPWPCVSFAGCDNSVVWCSVPELGHDIWWEAVGATWSFFDSL